MHTNHTYTTFTAATTLLHATCSCAIITTTYLESDLSLKKYIAFLDFGEIVKDTIILGLVWVFHHCGAVVVKFIEHLTIMKGLVV